MIHDLTGLQGRVQTFDDVTENNDFMHEIRILCQGKHWTTSKLTLINTCATNWDAFTETSLDREL